MHSRCYHFSYLAAISIVLSPALSLLAISDARAYAPIINARRTPASDRAQATDPKTQADKLFETGVKQHREGLFREAIQTFEQVLATRKQLGDKPGIGETLNNMGEVYAEMGSQPKALKFCGKLYSLTEKSAKGLVSRALSISSVSSTGLGTIFPKR